MRAIRRALRFSRAAQSLVSLLPSLALTACATAVPQAEIDEYYQRCVQGADPATMQAAYCGVAIDSGRLTRDQLADALAARGLLNERRGRMPEAERDLRQAAELRGEPYRGPAAQPPRVDRHSPSIARPEHARNVRLVFNGMACPRVQGDSVLYPANEIFANVVVIDESGRSRASKLPPRGVFGNVTAGSRRAGNQQLVWAGPSQYLSFQITVWEYDDGGPVVDTLTGIAVDFALTRGQRTLARAAVKGTVARTATHKALRDASDTLDLTGELSRHIATLPKSLLGTSNDLIGAIGVANVHPDAYAARRADNNFSYHFFTRHRKGGADCRFYFEFK